MRTRRRRARRRQGAQPMVVLTVEGGVVQSVLASRPVRVLTLDYDTDGDPEASLHAPSGHPVCVSYDDIPANPAYVAQVRQWALPHRTHANVQATLRAGGDVCPHCQSEDVRVTAIHEDEGVQYHRMRCHACDRPWTNLWRLVDAQMEETAHAP